jgi:hypothetical protein
VLTSLSNFTIDVLLLKVTPGQPSFELSNSTPSSLSLLVARHENLECFSTEVPIVTEVEYRATRWDTNAVRADYRPFGILQNAQSKYHERHINEVITNAENAKKNLGGPF